LSDIEYFLIISGIDCQLAVKKKSNFAV
jgi:hypothetical protein